MDRVTSRYCGTAGGASSFTAINTSIWLLLLLASHCGRVHMRCWDVKCNGFTVSTWQLQHCWGRQLHVVCRRPVRRNVCVDKLQLHRTVPYGHLWRYCWA